MALIITERSHIGSHFSRALGSDGLPLLRLPADWKGILIEESFIPAKIESGPQYTGMPMLSVGLSGAGQCWMRSGKRTLEVINGPPTFNILSSSFERDSARRNGKAGTCLSISLPPSVVQRYLPDRAGNFDLHTGYGKRDDVLRNMILTLAHELKSGLPNDTLYAEGLSLSILGWLCKHYSTSKKQVKELQKLSTLHKNRLISFINDSLDSDLSIENMALLLGMSPSHFTSLFRATFGTSPHQYVIKRRVDQAAFLLRSEPERSIMDIAIATGFSSQAHLTYSFKRYLKQTPAKWKKH